MKPAFDQDGVTLYCGGAEKLPLADESVQACVTSPPYWGLRDYGVEGQIGLEATPEEYVSKLVAVFREVRRTLKDDGTLWLNLGDCYAGSGRGGYAGGKSGLAGSPMTQDQSRIAKGSQKRAGLHAGAVDAGAIARAWVPAPAGLKQKDLVGVPWMVAFALRADGWWLRSDIVWSKPNPMPESVSDRPTKSHEYLFLLAKSGNYLCDMEAIKEPATDTGRVNGRDGRDEDPQAKPPGSRARTLARLDWTDRGRNKRSVWTVTPSQYPGAHFATFPPALIEPCILAGSKPGDLVLDPFNGSGTTGAVCQQWGRRYVGVDLNPDYVELSRRRFVQRQMFVIGGAA